MTATDTARQAVIFTRRVVRAQRRGRPRPAARDPQVIGAATRFAAELFHAGRRLPAH